MMISQWDYASIKADGITGRYVTLEKIKDFLDGLPDYFKRETLGTSVKGRPIELITLGHGDSRILMWSQMHGNESTTTKAVLDLLNFLQLQTPVVQDIFKTCTIKIIPILNPDGAFAYTRANANLIDLNRDAQDRSQPESRILRQVFDVFHPHFAFNLHDQRTIFNVGNTPKPATVSFLAPAHDAQRSISETRRSSMRLIAAMNRVLQQLIPGQVGRFDDSFNPNCVGDCFQMLGTPTVLFEAGHFPEDYTREKTRTFIFWALQSALEIISNNTISEYRMEEYLDIPENNQRFFDVLVKNVHLINPFFDEGINLGFMFKEVIQSDEIIFELQLAETGILEDYFGHKAYDCNSPKELALLQQNIQLLAKINSY